MCILKKAVILFFFFILAVQMAAGLNKKILIVSPHEDDETIACAGVIRKALEQGHEVKLLLVTNGDYDGEISRARERLRMTIEAMDILGLDKDNIIYFGYGDFTVLASAYTASDPFEVFQSRTGYTDTTYGFPSDPEIGIHDYHYLRFNGSHATYCRHNIFADFYDLLDNQRPDEIYLPSAMEDHRDHSTVNLFLMEALLELKSVIDYSPVLHEYNIYLKDFPRNILDSGIPVDNIVADVDAHSPYTWLLRESVSCPEEMVVPIPADGSPDPNNTNMKYRAYVAYDTSAWAYRRFIKSDEVFWKRETSSLSYSAIVFAPYDNSPDHLPEKVIDGVIMGAPYRNKQFPLDSYEWVTTGGYNKSYIYLIWKNPVKANRIVLYDRPNSTDNILSGTLYFDGNFSIPVSALPNNGTGKIVDFPTRSFSWVCFAIDDKIGSQPGLCEFEVYNRIKNIAPRAGVTVSSHNTYTSQLGTKATDREITGAPYNQKKEWVTNGETAGAWIFLNWETDFNISRIVLYDRPNLSDRITGGTIIFSDYSFLHVEALPDGGEGYEIELPVEKEIRWLSFLVDSATGENTGLSEIEVFGYPAIPEYKKENIASFARIRTSSERRLWKQMGERAVDGNKSGYPWDNSMEWVTNRERAGAWIRLEWDREYEVNHIFLYDRPNVVDNITDARISFSDGSSISVGALPYDGKVRIVKFSPKRISWLQLDIAGAEGVNTGLSEIEVFGEPVN